MVSKGLKKALLDEMLVVKWPSKVEGEAAGGGGPGSKHGRRRHQRVGWLGGQVVRADGAAADAVFASVCLCGCRQRERERENERENERERERMRERMRERERR